VIALLGLAATPAPTVTPAPAITSAPVVIVALISACAVIVAALVGAGAAIVAQRVSQGETTRRETAARRLREERVRKLFAARVTGLASLYDELAKFAEFPPVISKTSLQVWNISTQDMEETFELLAREFAIYELSLALEAEAIGIFGLQIPAMQHVIRLCKDRLVGLRRCTDAGLEPCDEQRDLRVLAKTLLTIANELLKALGERPYKRPQ
jgi:hypothetical protein